MIHRGHRQLFCYGENMHPDVIAERCAAPRVLGTARLPAFRVDFFGYGKRWDGALESVVKDRREETWGVLYALDFEDAELLDDHMDVRLDGTGPYFHYPVVVELADGSKTDALTYVKSEMGFFRPPTSQYLEFLVTGGRKRGLPKVYLERLLSIPNGPATYNVPRDVGRKAGACDCGGDLRQELRETLTRSGMCYA